MNELTLDGKTYISSKRAAEITGYAKDYVGQLCREGRIECRLVGRNWYVLESAIREHRFGKEEQTSTAAEASFADSAWEAPRYRPEVPTQIPSLRDRQSVNALQDAKRPSTAELLPDQSPVLKDMQSAWQEWFSMKQEQRAPEPPAIATEETALEEQTPNQTEPDTLVIQTIVQEEGAPSIYEPETTLDLSHAAPAGEYGEEATIIEERLIPVRSWGLGDLAVRSIFVAIALLAVVVTVIGTGYSGKFGDFGLSRVSEINSIAGVSVYNRK